MLEGDGGARRGDRVTELWAYLAVDPDDDCEGVVGHSIGSMMAPLIGADEARIRSYEPYARNVAAMSGREIKLVRFTQREDVSSFGGPNA